MTAGTTLPELVLQSNNLTNMIVAAGGELTPELEAALDKLDLSLAEKLDGYSFVIERMKMEAEYWKDRAAQSTKIQRACTNAEARIKDAIKNGMLAMGKKEIVGNDVRFVVSPTKERLVIDEALLPEEFKIVVTTKEPDNEKIRAKLAVMEPVPGCSLEGGFSLRTYANRGAK